MNEIFISYSRHNSSFVDQLKRELEQRGLSIWVDREDIRGGTAWRAAISNAIRACDVFIIVLSEQSIMSDNVTKELALADKHKKALIPICYQTCEVPPKMEYQLAGLQIIDFTLQPYQAALNQLMVSLPPHLWHSVERQTAQNYIPPQPANMGEPPRSPVRKKPNWTWIIAGIVGVLGIGICLCIAVFSLNSLQDRPAPEEVLRTPVEAVVPSDDLVITPEMVSPQEKVIVTPQASVPQPEEVPQVIPLADQSDALQEELSYSLSKAIQSEVTAYWYGDPAYAADSFYGDALAMLQQNIYDLNQKGLVLVENFDGVNSYIVEARIVNSNKFEVDACEYWITALYNRGTGALVSNASRTLAPQTITMEIIEGGRMMITDIQFYSDQAFCR